jgi:P4 family phage/plasmid primase-like protien
MITNNYSTEKTLSEILESEKSKETFEAETDFYLYGVREYLSCFHQEKEYPRSMDGLCLAISELRFRGKLSVLSLPWLNETDKLRLELLLYHHEKNLLEKAQIRKEVEKEHQVYGKTFDRVYAAFCHDAGFTDSTLEGETSNDRNTKKADTEWADEISETYLGHLAWDETKSQWFKYSVEHEGLWSPVDSIEILKIIKSAIQFQKRECGHSRIAAIEKVLRINLYETKWNQNPNLIPFRDGVLDLQTEELKPHSSEYRLTWQLPHNYYSESDSWEKIDNWLDFVTQGNQATKNLLIAFLANAIRNQGECQQFLHLQGIGGSGKSTFIRLAEDLIGSENHYSSSLNEWNNTRFESAGGYGMRLISFPDENNKIKNIESFKKLTGGDPVRFEEKCKKASTYKFTGSVIVASNHSPFVGGSASAIARREIPVFFNAHVASNQRRDLNAEFKDELPALSRHLLSLPNDWVQKNLKGHESFGVLTADSWANRCAGDSLAAWMDDCIVLGDFSTPVGNRKANSDDSPDECLTLYQSYTLYCHHNNYHPKSTRNFSSDLMEMGATVLGAALEKNHTRIGKVVKGLRLRKSSETDVLTITESLEMKALSPESNSPCDGLVTDSVTDSVTDESLAVTDCDECDGYSDNSFKGFSHPTESEKKQLINETTTEIKSLKSTWCSSMSDTEYRDRFQNLLRSRYGVSHRSQMTVDQLRDFCNILKQWGRSGDMVNQSEWTLSNTW